MPPSPKIATLPADVLLELHARLRQNGYAQAVAISEWLGSLGYSISKTTVNAYSQELRVLDAEAGDTSATIIQRRRKSGPTSSSRLGLLLELGRLRLREHQIIQELATLDESED